MLLLQSTEATESDLQAEKIPLPVVNCEEAKPSFRQSVNFCIVRGIDRANVVAL